MRFSRLRTPAISLAAILVLIVGSAGQAFAASQPDPGDNLQLESAVSVPALTPSLSLTLGADRQTAAPGQAITYTALVTNAGTTLTLSGTIAVTNPHQNAVSLAAWYDYVSFDPQGNCSADDNDNAGRNTTHWVPLAGAAGASAGYTASGKAPTTTGETFTAVPVPSDGVNYSSGSDTISGTYIERKATARWTFTAVIPLSSSQAAALFKGTAAYPIRASFHAEGPTGNSPDSDAATIVNAPFCRQLTVLKYTGAASDVRVAVTLPDGTVRTITKATVAALGAIAPGGSVSVNTAYTVPVPAPKGSAETDAAYTARLAALDGATLSASATARSGASGPLVGPAGPVNVTESLPILSVTKDGPPTVDAGATAAYRLSLANTGSGAASSVLVTDSLPDGTTIPVTGAPASLASKATATAYASYPVPVGQPTGNLTDIALLRWTDAGGNWYGPISSNATTSVIRRITPVIVTASSGSMTYGGTVPAITPAYTGWANGDGPAVLTSAPVCTTSATSAGGVGTYKTSCSGAAAPDYTFVYDDGSVIVTPALVTITAPSGSVTYGGTVPAIAPAYSGWVNGDGPAVLTTAPTCSTTATSASGVGTYKTSCTGAVAPNYTFVYVDGSVTVTPALVTITASSDSMTYGGTVPVITPSYSGWVNGDGPSVLTTAPVCSTAATSASSAGTYGSSCSGAAAANYTFGYVDGTISVNPSVVIVTASSGSLTYGGTVPAIAPSYSGWQNGDGPAVLTTAPTCSTAATSTNGVGTYKTSCSGAAAPNYTFIFAEGTITVTPALVTLTAPSGSMTYGGTVPAITPAYSGWQNGEGPAVLTTAPACSTSATSASGVGTYTTSCTGAAAANYTFSYVDGSVTVTPALVTITASSDSMTHGGTVPAITPSYSGLVNGEGPSVLTTAPTCSTVATSASSVGTYKTSCSGAAAANYTFGYVDGTISVGGVISTGLTLSPQSSGPLPLNSSHKFTVTATDSNGKPVSGAAIALTVVGPNATTANLTTGADGTATFTYTGTHAGTDIAQATGAGPNGTLASNTASAIWVAPVQTVSTTTIHGRFYHHTSDSAFTATPATPPLFEQDFPTINFDPVSGLVANNRGGVNPSTRPFTDVTTDLAGNYTGSIVAEGNGYQAGLGTLTGFDAAFTGSYTISAAGDYAFDVLADDGFVVGIGDGATALPGNIMVNPPVSGLTALAGLPVMGAYYRVTGPNPYSIKVHFPAPGVYRYEVHYNENGFSTLSLTIRLHSTGLGITPTGTLALSPTVTTDASIGSRKTFTVAAMDAGGAPIANLPVTLHVDGANAAQIGATTDARGLASFTYVGLNVGTDPIFALANIDGMPAVSNVLKQRWTQGPPSAPPAIGSQTPTDGAEITAPTPITASFAPPAGQTVATWKVELARTDDPAASKVLASGTGTPPATLATLDPTVLANGEYTITISAFASGGGGLSSSVEVTVDGNLKLGRYGVTYQDANVPVGGIPIQVLRSYDSFDKSKGAFGVGWALGVANFRVSANGALGAGGWSQYESSCTLGICHMAWATARPHFVSIVWPDGHTEIFDFTPTGGSNLFWIGTAAFTARAGSTSKLAVSGDASLSYKGDGNLYGGLGGPVFNPTRFTLTAKDGSVYVLDTTSGLVSETDRTGNTVTVDAAGIHSSLGPSITFVRDTAGRISELDKPDGTKVTYAYDAEGNLASVTDERNKTVTYHYDADHNLTETLDPDGHPLRTLTYWPDGRLKTVTDGAGNVTTLTLDPNARTEIVTGPDPRLTTVTSMNERGDIVQVDQVFGGKTLTTRFTYDSYGHVLSKTDPDGQVTRATYDAAGSPLTLTEPDGGTWTCTYNDQEQLTSIADRTARVVATLEYDSVGRLARMTTPTGVSTYAYGAGGRLASATNPLGRTTAYTYEGAGRLATVKVPDGRVWAYSYDADGRTKTVTDPASHVTTFRYDEAGNVTGFTDAAGRGQTYTYDALGRLATTTDGAGKTSTYTYDQAGLLSTVVNRNGATTHFGYDSAGRVTSMTSSDGTTVNYSYDAVGDLVEADNTDARLAFTYGNGGSLVSQTSAGTASSAQPTVTLSIDRDAAGRAKTLTAPWGAASFSYDGNGRLASVTDTSGSKFTIGYDPLGRLASLTRPNGVADTYSYTASGQLASRSSSKSGSIIDALSYGYDTSGRVATKTDSTGTATYSYDDADRLISVLAPSGSSVPNETFSYDGSGNQIGAGQTYDAANRLLFDAKYDYAYDGEGNLTSKTDRASGAITRYVWNTLHEMTSTTLPDGTVVSYRYDALGRRIEESTPSGATRFVNLGANVVAEYDGGNTLQATYLATLGSGDLPGVPLETSVGSTMSYPLLDQVGSVTGSTDQTGSLSTFSYTAYGRPVGASSGTYAYGTYGYDSATGLYYARARYYDPNSGRFLSEDSVPSGNGYPYAVDSPASASDPSGRCALVEYSEEASQEEAQAVKPLCEAGLSVAGDFLDQATTLVFSTALSLVDLPYGISGIYAFGDEKTGQTYVGRSVDIRRRILEHIRKGRVDAKRGLKYVEALQADLQQAEQAVMIECGGADWKKTLANKIGAMRDVGDLSDLGTTLLESMGAGGF
jgi:RHS repeat-associated protein/uncharacterized repeat protein (TIGR01451 family)